MSVSCRLRPVSPAISMVRTTTPSCSSSYAGPSPSSGVGDGGSGGGTCEEGGVAREPVPLPDVKEPSPQEVARHCLTHLPYRRWCRWCVMARRLGAPHRSLPPFSRSIPLLVMDYCFIKHAGDDKWLTVLVGRLYPSCAIFSVPCMQKGADPHVTARLASFLRSCGVSNMTYMSDQEGALRTMIVDALEVCKGRGEWIGAVPENPPVGESASNGRAERAVQRFEDHIRTLLAELEYRIGTALAPTSPVLAWLVEYVSVLLNKYHEHGSINLTSYEYLHGKAADEERLAYFGERGLFQHTQETRVQPGPTVVCGCVLGNNDVLE